MSNSLRLFFASFASCTNERMYYYRYFVYYIHPYSTLDSFIFSLIVVHFFFVCLSCVQFSARG